MSYNYMSVVFMYIFILIDALSVYLTDPSDPPLAGDSMDLSTMVNLYLESGMNKPDWIQVASYIIIYRTCYTCCHYSYVCP